MQIRSMLAGVAVIVVASATGVASASAPAIRSPGATFTVSAGDAPAGRTLALNGTAAIEPPGLWRDDETNIATCSDATTTARVTTGAGQSGKQLLVMPTRDMAFIDCTQPDGTPVTITASGVWVLTGTAPYLRCCGTTASMGAISKISLHVATTVSGEPCSLDVHGWTWGGYFNSTPLLDIPNIGHRWNHTVIENESGCEPLGLADDAVLHVGVDFKMRAHLRRFNPVLITSP